MISEILPHLKCTYISSELPDVNFAASNYLYVGTDSTGSNHQRILMAFDLSPLPTDILIKSAVLKLYADFTCEKSSISSLTPFLIASDWEEKDVTWNNQPRYDTLVSGETADISSSGWYTWDITNIAEEWIYNKRKNLGFMIISSKDKIGDIKRFQSSRGFYYKNLRPVIEIKYDFKNRFLLASRETVNIMKKYNTDDALCFSAWQNTSTYSTYTFFVQNIGNYPADIYVQISPDTYAIFEEEAQYSILPGHTEAIVPQRFGFYSRLAFKSYLAGRKTTLMIWFQAQV